MGQGSTSYLRSTAFNLHATKTKDENKYCLWWDSITNDIQRNYSSLINFEILYLYRQVGAVPWLSAVAAICNSLGSAAEKQIKYHEKFAQNWSI